MIHNTKVKAIGALKVPNPEYGDVKLNVFPIHNSNSRISLPKDFERWEDSVNEIIKQIPLIDGKNKHYVTIDSKFFATAGTLRREGVHADGNYCVDPNFTHASWGGTVVKPGWGGSSYHPKLIVVKPWVSEWDNELPIGDYITDKKGGIFCASSEVGCKAWEGVFEGEVMDEGSYHEMADQLQNSKEIIFEKDRLYFMSSNTPHESLSIKQGVRRTFIRITLNHEYPTHVILDSLN